MIPDGEHISEPERQRVNDPAEDLASRTPTDGEAAAVGIDGSDLQQTFPDWAPSGEHDVQGRKEKRPEGNDAAA